MAKHSFMNGASYSRKDVLRLIGMNPPPEWGPYVNGYFAIDGVHFIFCNIGVPGRTGHDYPNQFIDDRLRWYGKRKSRSSHHSIQSMIDAGAEVHIFFRRENRDRFTYLGLGRAISTNDEVPVEIVWAIEQPDELPEESGSPDANTHRHGTPFEGGVITVTVNKYERSPVARALCISHYGSTCQICDLSFKDIYGDWGDGFIHVHHIIPLAEIGKTYVVDPVKDLIPVCPNCHAMLHRKRAVISADQLRNLIKANRKSSD